MVLELAAHLSPLLLVATSKGRSYHPTWPAHVTPHNLKVSPSFPSPVLYSFSLQNLPPPESFRDAQFGSTAQVGDYFLESLPCGPREEEGSAKAFYVR